MRRDGKQSKEKKTDKIKTDAQTTERQRKSCQKYAMVQGIDRKRERVRGDKHKKTAPVTISHIPTPLNLLVHPICLLICLFISPSVYQSLCYRTHGVGIYASILTISDSSPLPFPLPLNLSAACMHACVHVCVRVCLHVAVTCMCMRGQHYA